MPAEITLPVHIRVGDQPEAYFGYFTIGLTDGLLDEAAYRKEVAAFLRAAAEEIENPSEDDEEVTGAAP